MAEELKELIDRIQQEGINAALDKSQKMEEEAKEKAGAIIQKAEKEASRLILEAKDRVSSMEDSGKASLKQAGRDLLLTLRKEINAMLDRIAVSHAHKALTSEEMAGMIATLVKECGSKGKEDITVLLRKEDLEKVEKGLMNELKEHMKKGVELKSSDDIRGGFIISYDSGRSYYDFTDKAVAEYLTGYLKPKLAQILDGGVL